MRKNIHLTYSRTMSSKNPEKSLQQSESHLFKNKQTAQAIDEDEENALFKAGEFVACEQQTYFRSSLHLPPKNNDGFSRRVKLGT